MQVQLQEEVLLYQTESLKRIPPRQHDKIVADECTKEESIDQRCDTKLQFQLLS